MVRRRPEIITTNIDSVVTLLESVKARGCVIIILYLFYYTGFTYTIR